MWGVQTLMSIGVLWAPVYVSCALINQYCGFSVLQLWDIYRDKSVLACPWICGDMRHAKLNKYWNLWVFGYVRCVESNQYLDPLDYLSLDVAADITVDITVLYTLLVNIITPNLFISFGKLNIKVNVNNTKKGSKYRLIPQHCLIFFYILFSRK